jgi:hypothetical protein
MAWAKEARNSGQLIYAAAAASGVDRVVPQSTPPTGPGDELCSATFPTPTACVLHLDVAPPAPLAWWSGGSSPLTPSRISFFAGFGESIASALPASGLGFVRIEYGDGQASRAIVADLKSGTYQVPPSLQVRVTAKCYTPSATAFAPTTRVRGAISPGTIPNPARLTYSHMQSMAAGASFDFQVPDGARWADCWSTYADPGVSGPRLLLRQQAVTGTHPMPVIMRDYPNASFVPSWGPVDIGGPDLYSPTITKLTLSNSVAASVNVIRFWLEM